MKGGKVITLDEKTDKPTAKVYPWNAKTVTLLDDIAIAVCHESSYAAASENKGRAHTAVKSNDGSTAVVYRNGLVTSFDKSGNRQVNALVTVFLSPGRGARERLTVTGCDSKKGGKVLNMDVQTGKPNGTWEPWSAKRMTMADDIAIAICREGAVAAIETKAKR